MTGRPGQGQGLDFRGVQLEPVFPDQKSVCAKQVVIWAVERWDKLQACTRLSADFQQKYFLSGDFKNTKPSQITGQSVRLFNIFDV